MSTPVPAHGPAPSSLVPRLLAVGALLFVFLMGVRGLGSGFRLLGTDVILSFFTATENPFVGLMIGLLATTLVQSSSVTTAMVVGLVAAPENPLPLANAVPMVMGANIGTTVTSTLVSLAHLGRRDEFERAFPVAICHDIFNYLTVLLLLPLELITGYLQWAATACAQVLRGVGGVDYDSPFTSALTLALAPIEAMARTIFAAPGGQAAFLIAANGLLIFFALFLLVRVLRAAVHAKVERVVGQVLGASGALSILMGILVTVMVQSSSITTSLLVPLAGAGLLTLEHAFPVAVGANIGTTVTALVAALAVSGPNAAAGLEIALVHLFFNLSGLAMIYPVQQVRAVPIRAARAITHLALHSQKLIVLWVLVLFYGLPALCILVTQALR